MKTIRRILLAWGILCLVGIAALAISDVRKPSVAVVASGDNTPEDVARGYPQEWKLTRHIPFKEKASVHNKQYTVLVMASVGLLVTALVIPRQRAGHFH